MINYSDRITQAIRASHQVLHFTVSFRHSRNLFICQWSTHNAKVSMRSTHLFVMCPPTRIRHACWINRFPARATVSNQRHWMAPRGNYEVAARRPLRALIEHPRAHSWGARNKHIILRSLCDCRQHWSPSWRALQLGVDALTLNAKGLFIRTKLCLCIGHVRSRS